MEKDFGGSRGCSWVPKVSEKEELSSLVRLAHATSKPTKPKASKDDSILHWRHSNCKIVGVTCSDKARNTVASKAKPNETNPSVSSCCQHTLTSSRGHGLTGCQLGHDLLHLELANRMDGHATVSVVTGNRNLAVRVWV